MRRRRGLSVVTAATAAAASAAAAARTRDGCGRVLIFGICHNLRRIFGEYICLFYSGDIYLKCNNDLLLKSFASTDPDLFRSDGRLNGLRFRPGADGPASNLRLSCSYRFLLVVGEIIPLILIRR